ncbi:MAG: AMP-binding protein, partial [Flavobacteriales bacterium]
MPRPNKPAPENIFSFFRNTASSRPESVALVNGQFHLTYSELATKAGRLAEHLQQNGITSGSNVGLCLERSSELIISVLSILQSGAAYVPIDPMYPTERIAIMLEDAIPPVVITDRAHAHLFPSSAKLLLIDETDLATGAVFQGQSPATPADLCYILFTSGSTGRPKGVAMHHAPMINLIQWQLRTSVLGHGDKTLQFAPISFDVSFQ